jgi:6-phosphogluconolactonase
MRIIVYVSCTEDKQVVGFEMDPATGALRELSRTAVPGTDVPSPGSLPLAVSPDRRWLYAALRTEPFPVVTFAIDPESGALRHAGTAKLGDSMCYLSTDQSGVRLFSASYGGAKLSVGPIEGGIAGDTEQVVATPPKAHCARLAPDGTFVYVACLGGDVILAQRFEAGRAAPTPNPAARTKTGAGPRHLAFANTSDRLYCLNELDGTLNAYDRDPASGALRQIQSASVLAEPASGSVAAADLHLTDDDRFLYASERTTNTLAAFRTDPATGRMSLIGHVPSEPNPRGFAIDPQGKFLLCAGMTSGKVATYEIDPDTGALRRTRAAEAGAGANWVEALRLG